MFNCPHCNAEHSRHRADRLRIIEQSIGTKQSLSTPYWEGQRAALLRNKDYELAYEHIDTLPHSHNRGGFIHIRI